MCLKQTQSTNLKRKQCLTYPKQSEQRGAQLEWGRRILNTRQEFLSVHHVAPFFSTPKIFTALTCYTHACTDNAAQTVPPKRTCHCAKQNIKLLWLKRPSRTRKMLTTEMAGGLTSARLSDTVFTDNMSQLLTRVFKDSVSTLKKRTCKRGDSSVASASHRHCVAGRPNAASRQSWCCHCQVKPRE